MHEGKKLVPEMNDIKRKTRCIGITGGVGAGKSAVLEYLKKTTRSRIFIADDEAKKLYTPGSPVFSRIVELAGEDILDAEGGLDRALFSQRLFSDRDLLEKVNATVHPAVESMILDAMAFEKAEGKRDFLFIEAALLIECGYDKLLDELWYVYASEDTRRRRLKERRGYTDEKIDGIFASQLKEDEYRRSCSRVIDNDADLEHMRSCVDDILRSIGD